MVPCQARRLQSGRCLAFAGYCRIAPAIAKGGWRVAAPGQGQPAVSFDEGFWPSVHKLDPGRSHRVIQALNLFAEKPEHPSLKLKPLRGDLEGLMSLRAGREVRVLLERRGDAYIWLEAGMRKDVYDRAARGRFIVNPARRFMGFVDPETPVDERRRPQPTGDSVLDVERRAFDHWTDAELNNAGFSDDEAADLRRCGDEYELLGLPWPGDRLDLALTLVEQTPEQAAGDADQESRLREAIDTFGGLSGISPLFGAEELDAIARAPIEDWMVFLHPDQRSLVTSTFSGPARVRGAAGTGKTVVALHRAAHLGSTAAKDSPVLFTTVTSSLPRILEQLYRRMPGSRSDRVVFRSVGELSVELLAGAGIRVRLDADSARQAVDEVAGPDELGVGHAYLYEEFSRLIAGRGLATVDDYLTASRSGRRHPFTGEVRKKVWALYEAWRARLDELGAVDPPLAAHQALHAVRSRAVDVPGHSAVVVDEAQDLSMVELLLLRRIANQGSRRDKPDGLVLVGDGAQRVQAGGYTLRNAGVEVRGRTAVLRVNYRNTAEITEAALAVAGDDVVLDLDEELRRGEAAPAASRHGVRPRALAFDDDEAEFAGLVGLIGELDASALIASGDIGVFVPPDQVQTILEALDERGISVLPVTEYDGTTGTEVKVGSHADAKGLEFKAVILPRLSRRHFPSPRTSETEGTRDESASLDVSRLFVAMTRARDVLIVTCADVWADAVVRGKDAFDHR
jgi:hypothetical protein